MLVSSSSVGVLTHSHVPLAHTQGPLEFTSVKVEPPKVLPGGMFAVKVALSHPLSAAGKLTVAGQAVVVTCSTTDVPKDATKASTTCKVDPSAVPGTYSLIVTLTTVSRVDQATKRPLTLESAARGTTSGTTTFTVLEVCSFTCLASNYHKAKASVHATPAITTV